VAIRKGVNSCKLVCKDVATGLPKVGRIPPGVPNKESTSRPAFLLVLRAYRIQIESFPHQIPSQCSLAFYAYGRTLNAIIAILCYSNRTASTRSQHNFYHLRG
jgi:hypothetical protein